MTAKICEFIITSIECEQRKVKACKCLIPEANHGLKSSISEKNIDRDVSHNGVKCVTLVFSIDLFPKDV